MRRRGRGLRPGLTLKSVIEGHLTDDRHLILRTLIELIRATEPTSAPLMTSGVTH